MFWLLLFVRLSVLPFPALFLSFPCPCPCTRTCPCPAPASAPAPIPDPPLPLPLPLPLSFKSSVPASPYPELTLSLSLLFPLPCPCRTGAKICPLLVFVMPSDLTSSCFPPIVTSPNSSHVPCLAPWPPYLTLYPPPPSCPNLAILPWSPIWPTPEFHSPCFPCQSPWRSFHSVLPFTSAAPFMPCPVVCLFFYLTHFRSLSPLHAIT